MLASFKTRKIKSFCKRCGDLFIIIFYYLYTETYFWFCTFLGSLLNCLLQVRVLERVESSLKKATDNIEGKDYGNALTAAEYVLSVSPSLISAKLLKANALLGLKQTSMALSALGYD